MDILLEYKFKKELFITYFCIYNKDSKYSTNIWNISKRRIHGINTWKYFIYAVAMKITPKTKLKIPDEKWK